MSRTRNSGVFSPNNISSIFPERLARRMVKERMYFKQDAFDLKISSPLFVDSGCKISTFFHSASS